MRISPILSTNCTIKIEVLRNNPTLNVNWKDLGTFGCAALHRACNNGHDAAVTILLAHPDINVNARNDFGCTPFVWCCTGRHASTLRLMLNDPRVQVNQPDDDGTTPLQEILKSGSLDVLKWWIASGREMHLGEPGKVQGDIKESYYSMEALAEAVSLFERFNTTPKETRHAIRKELGWYDGMAQVFALVVFVSDGLLQVSQGDEAATSPAARFFLISRRLPLELQMIVCCRVMGSSDEIIPGQATEAAFKNLAKTFTSS